jgi:hypothetical protein
MNKHTIYENYRIFSLRYVIIEAVSLIFLYVAFAVISSRKRHLLIIKSCSDTFFVMQLLYNGR